jgi:hypothetical protein
MNSESTLISVLYPNCPSLKTCARKHESFARSEAVEHVTQHLVLPWELDGLLDYSVLHEATEYGEMSDYEGANPSDLSNKDSFALWGKKGVWSYSHIDEHGLYTGVMCEEGEKLWYSWSLTDQEREKWAISREQNEGCPPERPGFPVSLRKGDLLIVPTGTVHAPLSLTNVVTHRFHVWCTRTMVQTARCALLDLRYPKITNEEPQKELRNKLQHLVRASKARLPPYTWGDKKDHCAFAALVKVSNYFELFQ